MKFKYVYTNEDGKGNGSAESGEFFGENITLEKLKQVEGILKKTREEIYKVLQGK